MERNCVITDKNFADWHAAYFGYGYGSGEEFWIPALHDLFGKVMAERTSYAYDQLERMFGGLAAWLLINTLCEARVLEYGTSPRFGWLAQEGELLRDYFVSRTPEQVSEVACSSRDDRCLVNWCNCTMTAKPCNPLFGGGGK